MTKEFFDEFPALWDAFEKRLEDPIVKTLEAKLSEEVDSRKTNLSSVYWKIGFAFWCSSKGMGSSWNTQLEEVFFERRYYDTTRQLTQYSNLDVLVAQRMENLNTLDAQKLYRLAVMPLLDERKQKLMAAFAEMGKELDNPLPYTLNLPVDGQETKMLLGFRNRQKKRSSDGMDGYTYFLTAEPIRMFSLSRRSPLNSFLRMSALQGMLLARWFSEGTPKFQPLTPATGNGTARRSSI